MKKGAKCAIDASEYGFPPIKASQLMEKHILQALVAAGAVRLVQVRGVPGGFVLVVSTEMGEELLTTQRGETRVFSKLDTAAFFLRDVGLTRFTVETAGWDKDGLI